MTSHATDVPTSALYTAAPTCGACGLTVDLGVVAATYRSRLRDITWRAVGKRLAARRIAAWNKHVALHAEPPRSI